MNSLQETHKKPKRREEIEFMPHTNTHKQRPLVAIYLLGLPFNPEAGGNRYFQNVSKLLLTTRGHICFNVNVNQKL
jgi:hypothetical protein